MNIAVVGSGYIGLAHIAAIQGLKDAKVVAVINRSEGANLKGLKAAGEGCRAYTTLKDALAHEKIDVIDVCTPTDTHEAFAIEAANAGCHVLCEKPVTFELDSLERMLAAAEKNGVRFMAAQVARWWPEFMEIKKFVDEGKLGPVRMVYEKRLAQVPSWSTWRENPAVSGGGLYDMNTHDIDFLYTLFGMPETVYASGWKSPSGCWDHMVTCLEWASGAKAAVETSISMTGNFPFSIEFRGSGDKGTLCYQLTAGHNIKDGEQGFDFNFYPAGSGEVVKLSAEQKDMFAGEIEGFLDAIRTGAPAPVTPDESRDVLKIVLATRKSLEEGAVQKL